MTNATAAFFVISGTILNGIGIAYAVRTLLIVWSNYSHEPLWPWVAKQKKKVKNVARRIMFWSNKGKQVHEVSASASFEIGASVEATLRKRLDFKDETRDAEKIRKLAEAVQYIYRELDENRERANKKHDRLTKSLTEISSRFNNESKRLEALSKEIATGDVRPQLISILLIGAGSFIAAIPTICALFF